MMFFLTISPSKLIVLSLDFSKSISIYLISPSQNFVTFLSKSYFQKLFFAYFEMFTITSDTFKPVLNQSSKHLEVFFFFFCLNIGFLTKIAIIGRLIWKRYSQNFMINTRKYGNKIVYKYKKDKLDKKQQIK